MANIKRIPDLNKGQLLHKKATKIGKANTLIASPGGRSAAATKDPRIDIRVYRSKTGNYAPIGDYFAVVTFYSHEKPNFAVAAPFLLRNKSEKDMDFEVGVLCGAMAERLGELYGDNFDPDKAAREGSRQLAAVLREWERQTRKAS